MKHLVLGGVRSGKSQFAEGWIASHADEVVYVATCQLWDEGMSERIARHRAHRPEHWHLIEEPIALAATLDQIAQERPQSGVIIECCSLWLTNLLCQEDEQQLAQQCQLFLAAVASFSNPLVLVSAEVGLGIMPMNALARRYGDEMGVLNQKLAKLCHAVTFVAAGLPMYLKRSEPG